MKNGKLRLRFAVTGQRLSRHVSEMNFLYCSAGPVAAWSRGLTLYSTVAADPTLGHAVSAAIICVIPHILVDCIVL